MQNGFTPRRRKPGLGLLFWMDSLLLKDRPAGKIWASWNKTVGGQGQHIIQQRRRRKQRRRRVRSVQRTDSKKRQGELRREGRHFWSVGSAFYIRKSFLSSATVWCSHRCSIIGARTTAPRQQHMEQAQNLQLIHTPPLVHYQILSVLPSSCTAVPLTHGDAFQDPSGCLKLWIVPNPLGFFPVRM